jgi:hypothetical protein
MCQINGVCLHVRATYVRIFVYMTHMMHMIARYVTARLAGMHLFHVHAVCIHTHIHGCRKLGKFYTLIYKYTYMATYIHLYIHTYIRAGMLKTGGNGAVANPTTQRA